ncbi:MAG: YbbR-like domain-containing protein [Bacteroidales bacterium]|nr:YbbR-like domain-containing protein [Bacteroidales bacterium]
MAEKKTLMRRIKLMIYKLQRTRINKNLLTYLVMVVIALTFWVINKMDSTIITEANFQVEYYGLPSNRILMPGVTTDMIKITLSAKGKQFITHRGEYSPIRIDLSKLNVRTFPESDSALKFVTNDDIRTQVETQIPTDYKFIALKPDTIKLDFGESNKKIVPVVLNYNATFGKQYRLAGEPVLMPDSVEIYGSAIIIDTVTAIHTESLSLHNITQTTTQRARLDLPTGVNCELTSTDATISVEKFTEGSVEVNLRVINVPDTVSIRFFSQKAKIKFNVGWNNYKKISSDMFSAEMDYNDLTGIVRPKYLTVRITKIPENLGVSNITVSPETVEYLIEKKIEQQ